MDLTEVNGELRSIKVKPSRSWVFRDRYTVVVTNYLMHKGVRYPETKAEASGTVDELKGLLLKSGVKEPDKFFDDIPETDEFGFTEKHKHPVCNKWPCECADRFGEWTDFEETTGQFSSEELIRCSADRVFANNKYGVFLKLVDASEHGLGDEYPVVHLSIKTHDKAPENDWREFQRIKNELVGPEREAFQIYPAESRLVDTCNQFHLWVLPEGDQLPIGFWARAVSEEAGTGAKQRPFPNDDRPSDLFSKEEIDDAVVRAAKAQLAKAQL